MNSDWVTVILKHFEAPDEVRMLEKGRFDLVRLGGMTIGRATYEPGWKWSEHVGPSVGATRPTDVKPGRVAQALSRRYHVCDRQRWRLSTGVGGQRLGSALSPPYEKRRAWSRGASETAS